jgi:hypothetical protein
MYSDYLMQVVDKLHNEVVQFEPGLSVEVNFIDDCVTRAIAKGVGIGRTSNHVAQDIRDAIEEAIYELKRKVR